VALRVIGPGFGRTGTDSMREALERLGFGPCHHMAVVNGDEEQKRLWRALARGENPGWEKLLGGFNACMDWPAAHYWRELVALYPDAKVVLTYRSPESWWESFEKTLLARMTESSDPASLGIALLRNQVFDGRPHDRALALERYQANVEAVKATVPPARLLVHELGDGWEPLCRHLGVPVPSEPYPQRNSAGEFNRRV